MRVFRAATMLLVLFAFGCGGGGGGSTSKPVPISQNQLPVAEAGADQTVTAGAMVTLVGGGEDPDGSISSVAWVQIAGNAVLLNGADNWNATFTAPSVNEPTSLIFQFTVTDDAGGIAADSIVVTVQPAAPGDQGGDNPPEPDPGPVNQPPVVDAGPDQVVTAGTTVTLAGTAQDPDGLIASVAWVQIAGNTVALNGSGNLTVSFTAPGVTQETTITFQLTAIDDSGGIASDAVTVTVKPVQVVQALRGVFLDSPVGGLYYRTDSFSGFTAADGSYLYAAGESVTFSIGNILFETVPADRILTPLDLVPGAVEITNPAVTNITRFLQTLDHDLNPDNGILITRQTFDAIDATGLSLDFAKATVAFETDPAVHAVLSAAGTIISGLSGLVDMEEARAHLRKTLNLLPPQPASALQASTLLGGAFEESQVAGLLTRDGTVLVKGRTGGFAGLDTNRIILPEETSVTSGSLIFLAELSADLRTLLRSAVLSDAFDSSGRMIGLPDGRLLVEVGGRLLEVDPNWQLLKVHDKSGIMAACVGPQHVVLVRWGDQAYFGWQEVEIYDHQMNPLSSVTLSPQLRVTGPASMLCGESDLIVAGIATGAVSLPSSAYDPLFGGIQDAFVARYTYDGQMTAGTFLGGSDSEAVGGVAQLSDGRVILAGTSFWNDGSRDSDFTAGTPGTLKPRMDRIRDGFVAILSEDLSTLERLTFIGGDRFVDNVDAMTVDLAGNIHLSGFTLSEDFPYTEGAGTPAFGGTSGFYMKLAPTLDRVFHASPLEMLPEGGIHTDAVGNATVIGWTNLTSYLTTPGAFQTVSLPPGPNYGPTNWDLALARFWLSEDP